MHVSTRSGLRLIGVFAAIALLLAFLQPNRTSAQTPPYTVTKQVSQAFTCPASGTGTTAPSTSTYTFGSSTSAAPGQCVAVQVTIANNSGSAVTSLTLADNLQAAGLIGQVYGTSAQSCIPVPTDATCTVNSAAFNFTSSTGYSLGTGTSGSEVFIAQVPADAPCTSTGVTPALSNTATANVNGSSTAITSSPATITVACPALAGVTFQKLVAGPNSATFGTTATAGPGSIITYDFRFTNTTSTRSSNVSISDSLAAGQTPVSNSCTTSTGVSCLASCAFSSGALTCSTPVVANGTTDVLVRVQLGSPFTGTSPISNTAFATFSGVGTLQSNSTAVTVTSVPTTVSQLSVCGLITAYTTPNSTTNTAGSITIGGLVIPIAVGATSNVAIATGVNECITFAFTNSQAGTLTVSSNLSGLTFACGAFTASSTAGQILVGGFPVTVAAGANFVGLLTPDAFYCFLLSNGQAFAALTGIPTAAQSLGGGGRVQEYMA